MKLFIIMIITVVGLGGIFIATQKHSSGSGQPSLTIQTVQTDVANGGQLIDVRTPEEYASSHVNGAINLSLQALQAGELPTVAKDKPIYVYCHSGNRSSQSAIILKAAGFMNVHDLGAMTHVQSIGGQITT